MKIETSVCDLHPTYEMRAADIGVVVGPYREKASIGNAFACTAPHCVRHWTDEFGYFPFIVGQNPNFGLIEGKPRCGNNHHVRCLVVTKLDDALVWACPCTEEDGRTLNCSTTQPFGKTST
jgi:hypothetical protein